MIVHFILFFKSFPKVGENMRRAAVICEFNPFHNGHKFLFEKIKNEYADEVVCIMSGNFVQRGDIAITDKYTRTKAALENGADIVVELPTPYAMSSANIFSKNGVRIAKSLNCDMLCFGAEDSLDTLTNMVDILDDDRTNDRIQTAMRNGQYYPKALSLAVGKAYAEIISKPNNILAFEYIRACRSYDIEPVAIRRKGVDHDDTKVCGDITSASNIRGMITKVEDYRQFTPMTVNHPCSLEKIESAILYRLKTITAKELAQIADVSEGLENRISEAAKQYNSLSEISESIKTKRYTMARIRRIILSAFLSITSEIQNTPVPYLRILGVRSGKESVLKNAKLPLIVKTKTDVNKLDNSAIEIFSVDLRAAEAMNLAGGTIINEYTQGVIKG